MARSITLQAVAEEATRDPGETRRRPHDMIEPGGHAGTEEARGGHRVSIPIAALLGLRSYSPPSPGAWEVAVSEPSGTAAAPAGEVGDDEGWEILIAWKRRFGF